jgi:hypothetical protein
MRDGQVLASTRLDALREPRVTATIDAKQTGHFKRRSVEIIDLARTNLRRSAPARRVLAPSKQSSGGQDKPGGKG